jgi:hypothetical protein
MKPLTYAVYATWLPTAAQMMAQMDAAGFHAYHCVLGRLSGRAYILLRGVLLAGCDHHELPGLMIHVCDSEEEAVSWIEEDDLRWTPARGAAS